MSKPTNRLAGACLLLLLTACAGRNKALPLEVTFIAPPTAMPAVGSTVAFQVEVSGGENVQIQWSRDGVPIPGAIGATLLLAPVAYGNRGAYQVRVADASTTFLGKPFVLAPVDTAWVVRSTDDSGPGTLREVLAATADASGLAGIQFAFPGEGPVTIHLQTPLPPITHKVCLLGPADRSLTLDAGGKLRPFFVDGTLILDGFTVANGLGKGGEGLGGGGGAAGMGGAVFLNKGTAEFRRMTFRDNKALGGGSAPGSDGENGGGGGFGGDSPVAAGTGASGGLLLGVGGEGYLDGSNAGGGPAIHGDGAGGGAARGGLLTVSASAWLSDNLPGGIATWGGGGGFSVGPEGGGGPAGNFGGGGGGSGGQAFEYRPGASLRVWLLGAGKGDAGVFGGEGGMGDGILGGRGGGGGGLGGAIFVRGGQLLLTSCTFTGNQALPGLGAEDGLGKGGAVFVYAFDEEKPFSLPMLQAQHYRDNFAPDLAEDPSFDNLDYYVAQDLLARRVGSPLALRYRLYRLGKAIGWPVIPR